MILDRETHPIGCPHCSFRILLCGGVCGTHSGVTELVRPPRRQCGAYLRNLSKLPSWVALLESEVVGAVTLEQHFPASFEVHFMAVRPEYHRRGIGHCLMEHLESEVRVRGGRWLQVKTMAPSYPDPFYAKTRAFYEAMGFSPLFESRTLWGPDTPAGVYVKTLGPP